MKYAYNCLKHQNNQKKYFHNFEMGQLVLEFGQRDGKMYLKFKKTGPRVIVTLGPTLTPGPRSHALRPGPGELFSSPEVVII